MSMTDMMFYGGAAGMVLAVILLLLLIPIHRAQRKRLIKKIENGEE